MSASKSNARPKAIQVWQTFGHWTVIACDEKKGWNRYWLCRCKCGVEKVIAQSSLLRGKSKSCGCLSAELASARVRVHGLRFSPEYNIWAGMKARCLNPNNPAYHHYGGRGITICDLWLGKNGFANFYADMGPRPSADHSLDRFPNNDGNYEKSNCRWATGIDQQKNTRLNRIIEYNGLSMTVTQWARQLEVSEFMLYQRLDAGWSDRDTIERPIRMTSLTRSGRMPV